MRDGAIELAGVLAILVALVHTILGETRVFARATIEPPWIRRLLRPIWHCGSIAWAGGGLLLMAAPSFRSEGARAWIILVMVVVYAAAAVANAWATRGRHIGWVLLACVVALALVGI